MKLYHTKIAVFLIVLIIASILSGQVYDPERQELHQPVYMDSVHNNLNFYDFSWNTAALLNDSRTTTFLVGYNSNYVSGAYHIPFKPSAINDHDFFIWSIYPFSEYDVFKGYFGYNHRIDKDVLWNDQSRMIDINPFLLGDSSKGDFTKNGLYWSAEWAHQFSRNWQSGFSFYYNVDHRIQDIFPKPINKHRDYTINLSLQYSTNLVDLGLSYIYRDEQEKVEISRYNLDQDLTPIIYKFRYSDLPVILRGSTSEEREMALKAHKLGAQGALRTGGLTTMLDVKITHGSGETFDGGTRRSPEGEMEINTFEGKARLDYAKIFFIEYQFDMLDLDAKHPDFNDLIVIRRYILNQNIKTGTKFYILPGVQSFTDLYYANRWDNMKDLMTENLWNYRTHIAGIRFGMDFNFTQRLQCRTWFGYTHYEVYDTHTTNNRYTEYFDVLYSDKANIYLAQDRDGYAGIKLSYYYRPLLDIELTGFYKKRTSKLEKYRQNVLFLLGLKLYIF
jgi:hypothetical protein